MSNSSFVPFSMMGADRKETIDKVIDRALRVLGEIHDAPHAAKENLMKTEFKTAAVELGFVGRLLQAESANLMAFSVMANRVGKSEEFRAMISENLPQIIIPPKKLKK
jgi:hypothetical protein